MPVKFYPDARDENADWTKGTWDLPVKNKKQLFAYLKETNTSLEAFKRRPVYRYNLKNIPWLKGL